MEPFLYYVPLWRGQGKVYLHQTFAYEVVFTVQFLGDAFLTAAFTRTACERDISVPESKSLGHVYLRLARRATIIICNWFVMWEV